MRDIETAINGTLHSAEDPSTGRCTRQTNIQEATERSWPIIDGLHQIFLARDISTPTVQRLQAQLVQNTTSDQQAGAIGGRIVSETNLDTITRQLMRVGGTHNAISLDAGIRDLTSDVAVADADNQTIFRGVILVLVLEDETLTGLVIGFTLTTPLKLNLVPLEVLLVLDYFDEPLQKQKENGG